MTDKEATPQNSEERIPQWFIKALLGLVVIAISGWVSWITTTTVSNTLRLGVVEATVQRVPIIEGKIDALLMERGIRPQDVGQHIKPVPSSNQ